MTTVGTCIGCGRLAVIEDGKVQPHDRPGCPGTGRTPRGSL